MFKLYNAHLDLSSDLSNYFKNVCPNISKPHLKLISPVILGMIEAESVITTDIVKKLKGKFSWINPFSTVRRLERFFNNPNFDIYHFYASIINDIISNYKPKNRNVYISFDHMFSKDKFTILLFSLHIGKQGIPLWFRCFKGINDPDAFKTSLINDGISYVIDLFKNKDCNLIFLADRWFSNCDILNYINSSGCTYCIRTKSNISIHIDNFLDSGNISTIADIDPFSLKSRFFDNVQITHKKFQTKLAVSKISSHKEPFFILTNGNTRDAIKHYGYRFGSIEFIFKNQKSNGFYLDASKMRNLHSFWSYVCCSFMAYYSWL